MDMADKTLQRRICTYLATMQIGISSQCPQNRIQAPMVFSVNSISKRSLIWYEKCIKHQEESMAGNYEHSCKHS